MVFMKGRLARLKNFGARARSFQKDLQKGVGFRRVEREGRSSQPQTIIVGTGMHRRLTKKNKPGELDRAEYIVSSLRQYLSSSRLTPSHYVLVDAKSDRQTGVQEYFNRPSIAELENFLTKGEKYVPTREEEQICRKFLGENRGVTSGMLGNAAGEVMRHISRALDHSYIPRPSNFIVLGVDRQKRLRLALVDW